MGKLMSIVLLALVLCYTMQVVVSQKEREHRRREERGIPAEEEEARAKEEEWRRREKTAEEERRHRRRWPEEEEEEEERRRPPRQKEKWEEEEEEEEILQPYRPVGPPGIGGRDAFLLRDSKRVVSTDAGEMRIVRGFGWRMVERPLHIGFITMEPRSLFVPQYLDSSLIIFIRRGEAKIGLIYDDELGERQLKMGDVYRIPAGSTFYIVNTGETQRLHIICSIDASKGIGYGTFQSFFIGGGLHPVSILAGFDPQTLSTAFNVTIGELQEMMTRQAAGPIIFADTIRAPNGTETPVMWANFLKLKEEERLERLKMVAPNGDEKTVDENDTKWSLWNILDPLLGKDNKKREGKGDRGTRTGSSPDSYNLYDRDPSFRNAYGWSVAVDKHEYEPLKKSGIGIYLVNLTAGSMMAPHLNPMATEYGIVLSGSGTIQVVLPNGTSGMNTQVKEGDVFWIPRYFPFCQIASRTGPFEFFGFTTSAYRNRPQFLVGDSSVLRTMRGPELATAFGLTEDKFYELVDSQREAVILPSPAAAPPDEGDVKANGAEFDVKRMPKFVRGVGREMVMGFE